MRILNRISHSETKALLFATFAVVVIWGLVLVPQWRNAIKTIPPALGLLVYGLTAVAVSFSALWWLKREEPRVYRGRGYELLTWGYTVLIGVAGAFSFWLETTVWSRNLQGEDLHIFHELGTALIIACIVTFVYELNARARFASATVSELLEKLIGDFVDTQLWREMLEQMLEKKAMRRNAHIRFRLHRRNDIPPNQLVLQVTMEYKLTRLGRNKQTVEVSHFVDGFMKHAASGLPRLTRVEIEGKALPLSNPYVFKKDEDLNNDRPAVLVYVEREELVYFPGAYNLLMSELTYVETIALHDVPDDIEVQVNFLFKEYKLTTQNAITPNRMLLPMQSIEVRFIPNPAATPLSDAAGASRLSRV